MKKPLSMGHSYMSFRLSKKEPRLVKAPIGMTCSRYQDMSLETPKTTATKGEEKWMRTGLVSTTEGGGR